MVRRGQRVVLSAFSEGGREMKKRICSALLALCLLLTILPVTAQAEQERFRTMEELTSYIFYDCAYMLADEIEFGYMQSLDYVFADDFPWKMLYSSGMADMKASIDRTHRRVTISDIEYYSGFKSAQAWEIEMLGLLDEDERSILAHAEAIVEEARLYAQSPYQVLVNLHDALVRRVTYEETDDSLGVTLQDTALGALLYGRAECDGYADAFYLLATLAGFETRMISGQADNGSGEGFGSHMWNLIWWENGWYHVDVTWDDLDFDQNASMTNYPYLLMGNSQITTHQWEEEALVSQPSPHTDWNHYYYTCDSSGITYGAYYKTLQDAANYVAYMQRNFDQRMMHVMLDGDYDGQYDAVNQALQSSGVTGSWWSWVKKRGEYTYLSVWLPD